MSFRILYATTTLPVSGQSSKTNSSSAAMIIRFGATCTTIHHYRKFRITAAESAAVILNFPPKEADYNIKHNLEPEYDFHAMNQVNSIMSIL